MRTEKIGLKKFLHFRKVPGFDSPECPCRQGMQSAKHVFTECPAHARERNRSWEGERRKAALAMAMTKKSTEETRGNTTKEVRTK